MARGDLTGSEWDIRNPLLPGRGERGPAVAFKRRTVNGMLWVLRAGAPWRGLPRRYGNGNPVFVRFTRWRKLGAWDAVFETRASLGPSGGEEHAIDSTIVRAHQPCSRRKRGNQNREAPGRSRGGFSAKIRLRPSAKGDPVTFELTGGEVHETQAFDARMELCGARSAKLLGDTGYDSNEIRNGLAARGIEPVIPPRSNRGEPAGYDREAYKRRNLIERCVNRLEQFRRIATRYEKTARAYLSMLCIAAARHWIKTVNTA